MNNRYEKLYNSKKISVEEALSKIKSGDEIVTALAGLEPMTLLSQLHSIKERIENVTVWFTLGMGSYKFFNEPSMKDHFITKTWFHGFGAREAHRFGTVSYQPCNLHNLSSRKLDIKAPNVFIGTVTPMDKHGYVKLPLSIAHEKDFLENADLVIMEVNPNLPDVWGDTQVHISEIDYFVEVNRPVPELPTAQITDIDKTIGQYVASLVKDGDTIQLGIGSIPNAAAQFLMEKKDLGVHTEMITSTMAILAENGVITGRKKTLHKGKIVGTFALGTQRLYDFLDKNPSIELRRVSYVNDPFVIAQNDNMVSINTALQVDLTGQVCSESIGTKQYSGTGGQSDTAVGAIHARNGRSIITLHSTAKNGSISTIQPWLTPGAVVTLSRNNVDYIITEYGIAYLKARTIRERVENLIAIAHPDFRQELRDTAFRNEIW